MPKAPANSQSSVVHECTEKRIDRSHEPTPSTKHISNMSSNHLNVHRLCQLKTGQSSKTYNFKDNARTMRYEVQRYLRNNGVFNKFVRLKIHSVSSHSQTAQAHRVIHTVITGESSALSVMPMESVQEEKRTADI